MIQRGEHTRFALQAREPVGVARERVRQELDRDIAIELRVARVVHLTHAARTEQGMHLIHTKAPAFNRHPRLGTVSSPRTTAGASRKLFARSSDDKSDSTSSRSASLSPQASAR